MLSENPGTMHKLNVLPFFLYWFTHFMSQIRIISTIFFFLCADVVRQRCTGVCYGNLGELSIIERGHRIFDMAVLLSTSIYRSEKKLVEGGDYSLDPTSCIRQNMSEERRAVA